jgi:staphylococcal nuclease domain-containing protein 1
MAGLKLKPGHVLVLTVVSTLCLQGRRDGSTKDEPFAWQSREFLRKRAVGKPCTFRIDYTLEAAGGRDFGTVYINDNENLALASVAAGMSRVRPAGGQQSQFYDDLVKAQEAAITKGLGVHATDPDSLAVRDASSAGDLDAAAFLQRVGKGRAVSAIVEAVPSGAMLRVTLLPDLIATLVMVAGVACPSMGRRGAADGSSEGVASEPFAREARHMTELRCLAKEVRLVLEGVSQHGVLVASVQHPPAGQTTVADENSGEDLGMALMKSGLGRAAEWSLNMMTSGAFKLREGERSAKQSKVGMWHNYVPQATNSAKLSDAFTGIVVEVVSGDGLVIKDASCGTERRVTLSSIRAPRMATRERAADPWAVEAKEFLRQRLIGKEVSVSLEYTRKVPFAGEERVMSFGTVTVSEKRPEKHNDSEIAKVNNVAELLLVRGLAQVVRHKSEEERSAHYEDLVNAEEAGKKGKKGVWSSKEPSTQRVNDVSGQGAAPRARQHLPFLQRAGKLTGVCEAVLGGSRVKIHVPKEGVTLAFSPSGVRCPGRDEPLAAEAMAFTRARVLQRDVQIEVEGVDKAGTFLGSLRVPQGNKAPLDLGVALLEAGLARLQTYGRSSEVTELVEAQDKARNARRGLWEHVKEEQEVEQNGAQEVDGAASGKNAAHEDAERTPQEMIVTDVTDANSFFVQLCNQPRVAWVAEQLSNLPLDDAAPPVVQLKIGDTCLAQFSADKQWYRARVERASVDYYDVVFVDYGNRDRVKSTQVRSTPADLAAVPPQAHRAALSFLRAPPLDDESGVEAAQRLSELVGGGRKLLAVVEEKRRADGPELLLTIFPGRPQKDADTASADEENAADCINAILVREGLARVVDPARGRVLSDGAKGVLGVLKEAQEEARRAHVGLWQYGDPGDDDEDDDGGFPVLGGKKR